MPVPETLLLYGAPNRIVVIGHQQPTAQALAQPGAPAWNAAGRNRHTTKAVAVHYTDGWVYHGWSARGGAWLGTQFSIDLDGSLYQAVEMAVRTNQMDGRPHFRNPVSPNYVVVGVEVIRMGNLQPQADGTYLHAGYNQRFRPVAAADIPAEVNYATMSDRAASPRRFSLRKIRGGIVLRSARFPVYYVKVAEFNDARTADNRAIWDILFTEEQYATLIPWIKSMCEMHRLPKGFFRDPVTGRENPWIGSDPLIRSREPAAVRDEWIERARAFDGIVGHVNYQNSHHDPGPAMDYYRIKRGVSDDWWYPIELNDTERPINYLDRARAADYIALPEYKDPDRFADYITLTESGSVGFFPIGSNRIWHGGVHFPTGGTARAVYAMAGGRIVAARIANGTVTAMGRTIDLPYSRCFVLVRHDVHVRNHGGGHEIDYERDSTEIVYSLYMHLAPLRVQRNDAGVFQEDYDTLPTWLNHYLIDHNDDGAPERGEIFYPDVPVLLSDAIGRTGRYIVGRGRPPVYGNTVHVEVFTAADVAQFGGSWWAGAGTRVEDASGIVCTVQQLIDLTQRTGDSLQDQRSFGEALRSYRHMAFRFRSEWSVGRPRDITREVWARWPVVRRSVLPTISPDQWEVHMKPLAFQAEMVAAGAPRAVVGPYLDDPVVWHVHPLFFMRWMNQRIQMHQQVLRSVDRPYLAPPRLTATVTVADGFVVGFTNPSPIPARSAHQTYPEVTFSGNSYEITVDALADQAALASTAQTTTRFRLVLLEAIDLINDRRRGLEVVESYAANAASDFAARHRAGRAVDLRPGQPGRIASWFDLFQSIVEATTYLDGKYGDGALRAVVIQNPGPGRTMAGPTASSQELSARLQTATSNTDPVLTAPATGAAANLMLELAAMRFHLETDV
jgi:hypothetical protein